MRLFVCRVCIVCVVLLSSGLVHADNNDDEIVKLQTLDAELEMCFLRKVKEYCDSRQVQKDASILPLTGNMWPLEPSSYLEDQLYFDLFRNYQKNSLAKTNGTGPVQVHVGFSLIQLNNLDEKSQVLTTSGWMEVAWTDIRLSWQNITAYENITNIVAPAKLLWLPDMALQNRCLSFRLRGYMRWVDQRLAFNDTKYPIDSFVVYARNIWLPDIGLQNSATDIYHSSLVDNKFRVNIYADGGVLWVPGGKYYTNCELDISYFPFDDQTCKLHFTNWAYNGDHMNLTVQEPHIDLVNYQVNGEWDIVHTTAHREDKFYNCCGDTPYPSIFFTIYMRRKYLFYITNIIAPCVMLSVLVTLVFYLPPEAGEKISLGITILLSFTVFLLLIAESIPKRSDSVPIISMYLATFLAITTTSIITTVIVLHIHHMGNRKVPRFARRLVFDILAWLLCMKAICKKYGSNGCDYMATPMETSINSVMVSSARNPSLLRDVKPQRISPKDPRKFHQANGKVAYSMKKSISETEDKIAQHYFVQRNYVLEEILMHIKAFTLERGVNEQNEAARQEWIALAKVLDRFFMCMFILFIALSSFLILIVLPMTKKKLEPE